MTDESKKEAERLAAEIFGRTMSAWNAVHTFRWMGRLGLPHATNQAAWQHERTSYHFCTAEEYADVIIGDRKRLVELGFVEKFAKAMTEQAVATFESILDAASLIFAHSVLDSVAFDWCRVCAIAEPEDLMPHVDKKRVTLAEMKEASFSQLLDSAIKTFLDSLERESVIKKLDIIFALCCPPRDFVGIEHYRYERDRIIALDDLRHEYVHRGGLGVRLPRGDDDLWYLFKTTNFLLPLVNQRYGIRIDPNHAVAAFGPPDQAAAQNPH